MNESVAAPSPPHRSLSVRRDEQRQEGRSEHPWQRLHTTGDAHLVAQRA
jgi:hypothetical protein